MDFTITEIKIEAAGRLSIGPLPGAGGDLTSDLAMLGAWRVDLVLSLVRREELVRFDALNLGEALGQHGATWHHMGVPDMGVPAEGSAEIWNAMLAELHRALDQNKRVFIHCLAGKGRSGMVILRLLIERGMTPEAALKHLRDQRPGAVETEAQYLWACGVRPAGPLR